MPIKTVVPSFSTVEIYMGAIYKGTPTKLSVTAVNDFSLLSITQDITIILTPTGIINNQIELGEIGTVFINMVESNNILTLSCMNETADTISVYVQEILSYGKLACVYI